MNGATVDGELPAAGELSDRRPLDPVPAAATSSREVDALLEDFEFAKVCDALYHFAWDEVCDWYVELAKPRAGRGRRARPTAPGAVLGARAGRAAAAAAPGHPVRHRGAVDRADRRRVASSIARLADRRRAAGRRRRPRPGRRRCRRLVTEVRRFRSDQGLPPTAAGRRPARRARRRPALGAHEPLIRLAGPAGAAPATGFAPTATLEVALSRRQVTVELDTSGAIDVAAERARLAEGPGRRREGARQAGEEARQRGVRRKAPAEVVDDIRGRRPRRPRTSSGSRRGWRRCRRDRTRGATAIPTATTSRGRCRIPATGRDRDAESDATASRRDADPDDVPAASPRVRTPPSSSRSRPRWTGAGPRRRWSRRWTGSRRCSTCSATRSAATRSIHLTGTNGKTSTARMIDALLASVRAAHRPLHQPAPADRSPSGSASTAQPITPERFVEIYRDVAPFVDLVDAARTAVPLSYFEVLTAMAFAAFADAPVDVGGRRGRARRPLGRHQRRRRRGRGDHARSGWTTPSTSATRSPRSPGEGRASSSRARSP